MNVLMMVTWYTPQGAEKLQAGIFHNEQTQALNKYCNAAIYYPMDETLNSSFCKKVEWQVLTYRSKYLKIMPTTNFFGKIKNKIKLLFNYINIILKFQKVKRDFNPDIIHAHVALGIGVLATFLGKLYGIPVVISEHTPVELIDYKNNKMNQKTGRYVYRNSKFNSCCSNDLKNKLQQIFPTCKFDTIYNGLNQPRLDENVKEKYRINDVINIVIVAILYDKEIKGMQYLLPAIKKVKEKGKKIVLHHIGGGEYLEYYKNVCKDLELEDSCIFYGQCEKEKVNNIISEMDFFVSASLMEASGVSVMEAMMLGKPILGTNSGGVDSLVPEFAGKIVNKGSSSALEQGILYMVEHLLEFDENKIRKYAIENYDMDTISQRYMQVYEHIVRK